MLLSVLFARNVFGIVMFYDVFGCLLDVLRNLWFGKQLELHFFFPYPSKVHPVPMTGIGRTAPSTNLFYCTLA